MKSGGAALGNQDSREAAVGDEASERTSGSEAVLELGDADPVDALRELRRRLPPMLDAGPTRLVLDVSRIPQLSSTTVAVILWIKRRCRSRGTVVVLREPSRRSAEMLRRAGLQDALPVETRRAGRTVRRRATRTAGRPG
jgi:anti-anti-sigma factor